MVRSSSFSRKLTLPRNCATSLSVLLPSAMNFSFDSRNAINWEIDMVWPIATALSAKTIANRRYRILYLFSHAFDIVDLLRNRHTVVQSHTTRRGPAYHCRQLIRRP